MKCYNTKNMQITSRQTAVSIYWNAGYQLWKDVKSEKFCRLPEGKWVKYPKKANFRGGRRHRFFFLCNPPFFYVTPGLHKKGYINFFRGCRRLHKEGLHKQFHNTRGYIKGLHKLFLWFRGYIRGLHKGFLKYSGGYIKRGYINFSRKSGVT